MIDIFGVELPHFEIVFKIIKDGEENFVNVSQGIINSWGFDMWSQKGIETQNNLNRANLNPQTSLDEYITDSTSFERGASVGFFSGLTGSVVVHKSYWGGLVMLPTLSAVSSFAALKLGGWDKTSFLF